MGSIALPRIDHPDFPPGSPYIPVETLPPPPKILRQMLGPRPYMPVAPSSLKVGDRIARVSYMMPVWKTGTITNIERRPEADSYLFITTDERSSTPGKPYTFSILSDFGPGNSMWIYPIARKLKPDEAKGLSEISVSEELPHDVIANIREALTGKRPLRFTPGAVKGGTRRAKRRKQTRRRRR